MVHEAYECRHENADVNLVKVPPSLVDLFHQSVPGGLIIEVFLVAQCTDRVDYGSCVRYLCEGILLKQDCLELGVLLLVVWRLSDQVEKPEEKPVTLLRSFLELGEKGIVESLDHHRVTNSVLGYQSHHLFDHRNAQG